MPDNDSMHTYLNGWQIGMLDSCAHIYKDSLVVTSSACPELLDKLHNTEGGFRTKNRWILRNVASRKRILMWWGENTRYRKQEIEDALTAFGVVRAEPLKGI